MLKIDKVYEFVAERFYTEDDKKLVEKEDKIPRVAKLSIIFAVLLVLGCIIGKVISMFKTKIAQLVKKKLEQTIKDFMFNKTLQIFTVGYISYCVMAKNYLGSENKIPGIVFLVILVMIPVGLFFFMIV